MRISSRRVGPSQVRPARPGMFSMMRSSSLLNNCTENLCCSGEPRVSPGLGLRAGRPRDTSAPLAASSFVGRRDSVARYRSSTMAASLLPARTALVTRPFGSATASEIVLPLMRFKACGRLKSARRSHSHADSRDGRPNRSRKPSLPT